MEWMVLSVMLLLPTAVHDSESSVLSATPRAVSVLRISVFSAQGQMQIDALDVPRPFVAFVFVVVDVHNSHLLDQKHPTAT
jgi:hypothetical protein